ncbi:MAG: YggT family protein [Actinobacteria bacterium]|nr:YggT family protein [Actinomycetota bacterium]
MENEEVKVGSESSSGAEQQTAVENPPVTGAQQPSTNTAPSGMPAAPVHAQAPTVSVTVGEKKTEEVHHVYQPRYKRVAFQVVDFIFWVGSALLLLRLALKLAGANASNDFVTFVYNLSNKPVGIFKDIVGEVKLTEANIIEVSTLIALLVFWLLYMIAKKLVMMMTTPK